MITDPELLTEWAERVVDAEEELLLTEQLAEVWAAVHQLADRAESIAALNRSCRLGHGSSQIVAGVVDQLERLISVMGVHR